MRNDIPLPIRIDLLIGFSNITKQIWEIIRATNEAITSEKVLFGKIILVTTINGQCQRYHP